MADLISRAAAIDALDVLCQEHEYRIPGKRETYSQYNEAWQDALDRAEGAIGLLPSAQQGRKKGRWIGYKAEEKKWQRDDGEPIFLMCSECNRKIINIGSTLGNFCPNRHWNFCPHCGTKMETEKGGEK